ncbi:hypothetical protein [Acidithiobacillus sp.]
MAKAGEDIKIIGFTFRQAALACAQMFERSGRGSEVLRPGRRGYAGCAWSLHRAEHLTIHHGIWAGPQGLAPGKKSQFTYK